MDKIYQCKDRDPSKYLLDLRNINVSVTSTIVYFHGNFTIKEEILGPIHLNIHASRSPIKTKLNQYESFINHTIGNMCEIMTNPLMLGNRYMAKFKPQISCPLKAGVVDISEADMILDSILQLPVEGFAWIIKGVFMGRRSTSAKMQAIGCLMVHFRVLKMQNKGDNIDKLSFFI